jgi:hypothetical protein
MLIAKMRIFTWLYPDYAELADRKKQSQLLDRLKQLQADGVYFMASYEDLETRRDVIALLIGQWADVGIETHIGLIPFSPQPNPPSEARERRYQYRLNGKLQYGNLCPSWQENRELACQRAETICREFKPVGLHLDFIRYLFANNTSFGVNLEWESGRKWIDTYHPCQCRACAQARAEIVAREGFNEYDAYHPAVIFKELELRKRNIDEVLGRIRSIAISYGVKLSIACRVQYLNRALIEGQDWVEWCRRGMVDFISPMNYSTSLETVKERMAENMARLKGTTVKVYEGLGKKSSAGYNPPAEFFKQAEAALEEGADGIAIFHYGVLEEEDIERLSKLKG